MDDNKNIHWHQVIGISTDEMKHAAAEAEARYGDILNMEHPVSKKHPQMAMEMRAAQFAPFAALTGYEKVVERSVDEVRESFLSKD